MCPLVEKSGEEKSGKHPTGGEKNENARGC